MVPTGLDDAPLKAPPQQPHSAHRGQPRAGRPDAPGSTRSRCRRHALPRRDLYLSHHRRDDSGSPRDRSCPATRRDLRLRHHSHGAPDRRDLDETPTRPMTWLCRRLKRPSDIELVVLRVNGVHGPASCESSSSSDLITTWCARLPHGRARHAASSRGPT